MACAASITALSPEPQTLFTVTAEIEVGKPAFRAAWRAGACPCPAASTITAKGEVAAGGDEFIAAKLVHDDDVFYTDERETDEHCCQRAVKFLEWLKVEYFPIGS